MKKFFLAFIVFLFCTSVFGAKDTCVRTVIFDLDDTLLNTRPRSLEAFHQVGVEQNMSDLVKLELNQIDPYIKAPSCNATLRKAGIDDSYRILKICGDPSLAGSDRASLWGLKYHGDPNFGRYDIPVAGAPEFVKKLNAAGFKITYLTARRDSKRPVTRAQLDFFGFPAPGDPKDLNANQLLMAPDDFKGSDTLFKQNIVRSLLQHYTIAAAFDDLLANANMFRSELPPDVPVIRPHEDINADLDKISGGVEQISNYYQNIALEKDGTKKVIPNQIILDKIVLKASQAKQNCLEK